MSRANCISAVYKQALLRNSLYVYGERLVICRLYQAR